ncbi:MAG: hypothetical protein IJU20_00690 [Clostridia bacterium]|nr:hypothetical protein [Clostridia bacterium]
MVPKIAKLLLQKTVSGWEIRQREPTPEELATLLDKTVWMNTITQDGISYHIYNRNESNSEASVTGILECYQNGEKLWSTEFKNNYIHGCTYTKEAVLCWGEAEAYTKHDWIALVDNKDGKMKWQHQLDHSSEWDRIATVLTNDNNTWTVISQIDSKSICLSDYGTDGKELSSHKAEIGESYGIRNAAKLEDGYIIQLWNSLSKETAVLCKMDLEGNLSDVFSYTEDDCDYYITDMIEFEGRIYLSAYAVPAQEEKFGRLREMPKILDYILANSDRLFEISSEELTPIVRDNYTAMLLVCDPEEGTPNTFYAVEGSWGGHLSLNTSGQLEWTVESITSAFYSPATSSYMINGNCAVLRYTFSAGGVFAGYTDTGDVVYYQK